MSPSYLRGRGLRAYRSSLDQRRECSIADIVVDTVPESEKPEIKIPRVPLLGPLASFLQLGSFILDLALVAPGLLRT